MGAARGEMALVRHVGGQRIRIATANQTGDVRRRAFRPSAARLSPAATARLPKRCSQADSSDSRPASWDACSAEWSPVAKHLLDGYLQRLESIEATVRERERLISLGRLAAGLAHEVNNPAAAAMRATADLRTARSKLQDVVGWLASANLPADRLRDC